MVNRVRDTLGNDLALAPRTIGNRDEALDLAVDSFRFFLTCSVNSISTPQIYQVMKREVVHVAFDVRPSLESPSFAPLWLVSYLSYCRLRI